MKVATYIAKFLKQKDIKVVFELQGGMITHILDSLHKEGGIEIVSMHHEQAASFAADAYARVTRKPGVALATSGPGATNLITGIGSCYFDSVPAIFITGQVNLNEQKGLNGTRQLGFQETDIVEIVKPITKAAFAVKLAAELPHILEESYRISTEGRPGPVLIDIPMNIQREVIDDTRILNTENLTPKIEVNYGIIDDFYNRLNSALSVSSKPLVLAGHGIATSGTQFEFKEFIEKYNFPVVTSLLGLDILPYNHPNRIGMIGAYGNRWANYALGNCDLLIVLGSRLDIRQTGADIKAFKENKKIFHVDCDNSELNNRIKDCTALNADLCHFFDFVLKQSNNPLDIRQWLANVLDKKKILSDVDELKDISGINPNIFMHSLSQRASDIKVFVTDVGNNQMWAAQSLEIYEGQQLLSSGGMGAMGYSLPAAIGASFALNKTPVVSISGDGGFQINIQELQTIVRNNLPVKIVILNNHSLGMIRQFQDSYFESCYQSSVWGYSAPDFAKLSNAYGIKGISIENPAEIDSALEVFFKEPNEPVLLNVNISTSTNAYPKLLFGMPLSKMEPLENDLY